MILIYKLNSLRFHIFFLCIWYKDGVQNFLAFHHIVTQNKEHDLLLTGSSDVCFFSEFVCCLVLLVLTWFFMFQDIPDTKTSQNPHQNHWASWTQTFFCTWFQLYPNECCCQRLIKQYRKNIFLTIKYLSNFT